MRRTQKKCHCHWCKKSRFVLRQGREDLLLKERAEEIAEERKQSATKTNSGKRPDAKLNGSNRKADG